MKVKEVIEELKNFDGELDLVDYEGDVIKSIHRKEIVDSDYPHEFKSHIAICVDCDETCYSEITIIDEILSFLGEEGIKYFTETDTKFGEKYYWKGRQIRNHIIDKFPNVVKWLGNYQRFEDEMFELTKRAIEEITEKE